MTKRSTNTKPVQVYAYLRVSSIGQTDGHGYDRQLAAIQQFCKQAGFEIADTYRESVSGTKGQEDRPEFQRMVSNILRNGVKCIVVESLDRLVRSYVVADQLLAYLSTKGINLYVANTGENVTDAINDDPVKRGMQQILMTFAEMDKGLIVKKLRLAREKVRAEKGKCEGRKSYTETDEGKAVIMMVRRLRRKGKNKKLPSWQEVCDQLTEAGHMNKAGRPFKPAALQVLMSRLKKRSASTRRAR
jgi:DNA invertase Pin-like site-specific DNA recombinase